MWGERHCLVPTLGTGEEPGPWAPSSDKAGLGPGPNASVVLAEEWGKKKIQL